MKSIFQNKAQIQELLAIAEADDKGKTKELISQFDKLKKERNPFYITLEEFEKILVWKLRSQYGRQREKRKENTNDNIIAITKAAFSIKHNDEDIEIALKLKILCTITGVEVPVASAILTLCYPAQFSVTDIRNWRQVYQPTTPKTYYSTKEYIEYLKIIRAWALEFSFTPQEIDLAVWQKDWEETRT
jgi:thermostable 8-oxoguanine DNA glycosylase